MKIEVYSPTIRRKEMDAVLTAMVEDRIGPGERSRLLIQTAKEQLRFDYALALRSPATALHLALKALDLEEGQGVIISALSPRYYAQTLADLRLVPLYGDVSYTFPCMSRESIEKALEKKPDGVQARCIVLHHTLGFQPDTASIAELGLPVIEDISQSYGVPAATAAAELAKETAEQGITPNSHKEENSGAESKERVQGVFTILGLEERDMLTSGGGALLYAMNRRDASVLRNYAGIPPEYCLPDINAALATVQFKEAVRNMERRQEIARIYTQASLRTKHKRFIPLEEGEYNNYAFSLILESGLKDVVAYARKKEIAVESAFEYTLAGAGISDSGACPVSYSLSLRTVLFPLYPRLRSPEAERVSKLIMTLP
ncbi:MAG: DegT/DnrJ/EryC1/StrS family aminotransferase [Treponema sp.]|jgi:dTDP-4-amino-4,6-dideoxygalactose transaminase|nr:DegT/DnrJ/EryC1/StrS family aminotransferase [Treponema sp.]